MKARAEEAAFKGQPCLCDFIWLDDAALSALSPDALLKVAAQYRDIILGMEKERAELADAFRTVLERNNILIKDVFGRKSERLAVLPGGSQPAGGEVPDEGEDNDENTDGASPSKNPDEAPVTEKGNKGNPADRSSRDDENGQDGQAEK